MSTIKDFLQGNTNNGENKQTNKNEIKEQQVQSKIEVQSKVEQVKKVESEKKKEVRKTRNFYIKLKLSLKRMASKINPKLWKDWIVSHYYEYRRVFNLSKKPDREEFKELGVVVAISALLVGLVGLVLELIFYFV